MIRRGLRHMEWANDRFFTSLSALPDGALTVSYAPSAWTVGSLAAHIVDGAQWYRHCLTGAAWTDLVEPKTGADVEVLRVHLGQLDALLVAEAAVPEAMMRFRDEAGEAQALRSTLLSQAIHHATEHRAQISCALTAHGFDGPSLDDLDLWAFEAWEREHGG